MLYLESGKSNRDDAMALNLTLDYSITSPQERNELVTRICAAADINSLTPRYLETMADYLLFAMNKEERKEKEILTENRMITVNKREISYQGLTAKFENGEDGVYNLITEDHNILLSPKKSITTADVQEIPGLAELRAAIAVVERQARSAQGRVKYLLKKQAIEMRQDQYILKDAYRRSFSFPNTPHNFFTIPFDEGVYINPATQEPYSLGTLTFFNPKHISLLLNDYSRLKQDAWGQFTSDSYYIMEDLDNLIDSALEEKYPQFYDLLIWKIDGVSNPEIQQHLLNKYNLYYTTQYISSLWNKKIPTLIAEKAKENYLVWYYTYCKRGKWKKCTRCGQIKLVHNRFFSKNRSSHDGFYSICKECRNAAAREKRKKKRQKNSGHI